jgi:hypothetical protein
LPRRSRSSWPNTTTSIQIVRDRAEILERMSSLARQLDALTHRALAVGVDVEQLAPPPPAPTHGRPPRKGTRKGRRPAREPRRGPAKPRRAPGVRHANGEGTKEQLLVWLGGRDEPASVVQMVEALGVHRTSIDQAIAKCNGQLAKVQEARGPKPALYLRADQLPREGWPHTEREARAQHVPDWVNPEEERAGAVKRRGEGLREKGAILPAEAEAEPVEPEEPIEEPTAEPEEVTPDQVEHPEPTEEEPPGWPIWSSARLGPALGARRAARRSDRRAARRGSRRRRASDARAQDRWQDPQAERRCLRGAARHRLTLNRKEILTMDRTFIGFVVFFGLGVVWALISDWRRMAASPPRTHRAAPAPLAQPATTAATKSSRSATSTSTAR